MCLSISKALILMQNTPQIWKLCTVLPWVLENSKRSVLPLFHKTQVIYKFRMSCWNFSFSRCISLISQSKLSELVKTSVMWLLAQYTVVFPAIMQTNPQKYSSTCTHTKPLSYKDIIMLKESYSMEWQHAKHFKSNWKGCRN